MKNVISILIGPSGCGKSTKAHEFKNDGHIIINADLMRSVIGTGEEDQTVNFPVFQTLERMFEYLLKQGYNLVIDNTNLFPKARKTWVKLGKKYNYTIEGYIFDTPKEICIERDSKRSRLVGKDIIEFQVARYITPTIEEGFDKIISVKYEN